MCHLREGAQGQAISQPTPMPSIYIPSSLSRRLGGGGGSGSNSAGEDRMVMACVCGTGLGVGVCMCASLSSFFYLYKQIRKKIPE